VFFWRFARHNTEKSTDYATREQTTLPAQHCIKIYICGGTLIGSDCQTNTHSLVQSTLQWHDIPDPNRFFFERSENILFQHILIRRDLTYFIRKTGPKNHTTTTYKLHPAVIPTMTNKWQSSSSAHNEEPQLCPKLRDKALSKHQVITQEQTRLKKAKSTRFSLPTTATTKHGFKSSLSSSSTPWHNYSNFPKATNDCHHRLKGRMTPDSHNNTFKKVKTPMTPLADPQIGSVFTQRKLAG
jgi:hypothetical protein